MQPSVRAALAAVVAVAAVATLGAGCASHRSRYQRNNAVARELIWAYDNRLQVAVDGRKVAESGDWGDLSPVVACSPEAHDWADSAASRDRTGKALSWTGAAIILAATAAGSYLVFEDTDNTDQMLTGLGVMGGGLVVGMSTALPGVYLRASAETRAIDAVNRYNDDVWSGACRQ